MELLTIRGTLHRVSKEEREIEKKIPKWRGKKKGPLIPPRVHNLTRRQQKGKKRKPSHPAQEGKHAEQNPSRGGRKNSTHGGNFASKRGTLR